MSIFFAMVGDGNDRLPAFYLTRNAAPEGAIEITTARHRALLEAQAEGRTITADARGRPVIDRRTRPRADAMRPQLRAAIRREAALRIHAISPEWQQLNDLRHPTEAGAIRFAQIDAVRGASNAIEELADTVAIGDLASFPVATHMLWPEFD